VAFVLDQYQRNWLAISKDVAWALDPSACPWDDPAFYALEGLGKLLEAAQGATEPAFEGHPELVDPIRLIARLACRAEFYELASSPTDKVKSWGSGTKRLQKMYWQQVLTLRMKAVQLLGGPSCPALCIDDFGAEDRALIATMRGPLTRAIITDCEARGTSPPANAQAGVRRDNWIRDAIIWLHDAFVRFGTIPTAANNADPLADAPILPDQSEADATGSPYAVHDDRFLKLLHYLKPDDDNIAASPPQNEIRPAELAIETLFAIARRENLPPLLNKRPNLLTNLAGAKPFPPLPGIASERFVLHSESTDPNDKRLNMLKIVELTQSTTPIGDAPRFEAIELTDSAVPFELNLDWKNDIVAATTMVVRSTSAQQYKFFVQGEPQKHSSNITPATLKWVAKLFDGLGVCAAEAD